ncbi:MAG: hypothetical protein J3Q66DRAFT_188384 [Benniella sp.]|nr:MAG: hypothetical protein J3Q66DRAFT_188384 [Benniella sp.]
MRYDEFLEIEQWRERMNEVCRASQQEYARTADDIPSEDDLAGWLESDMADDAADQVQRKAVPHCSQSGQVPPCEGRTRCAIADELGAGQRDLESAPAQMGQAEAMEGTGSQGVTQPVVTDMDMDSVLGPEEDRERVRTAGWETLRKMKEEQRQLLQEKISRAVQSYKRQKTVAMEPEERIRFLDKASKELRRDLEAEETCARLLD